MRALSKDEITTAREETKLTAEELSAIALRVHTEAMRPRPQVAPDVFPGCDRDTRPRWRGQLVEPLDKKIEYL
jgi:hypothetical protein